jgi:5-methylcytosine-specific restriction endonuclease McrA
MLIVVNSTTLKRMNNKRIDWLNEQWLTEYIATPQEARTDKRSLAVYTENVIIVLLHSLGCSSVTLAFDHVKFYNYPENEFN